MKKRIYAVLFVAAVLPSCTTMDAQQRAELTAQANRSVTCKKGDDCEMKWSKATQWVKENCEYKFQTVSDNVIQTMGPLPYDPSPAYTITKMSDGNGVYTFDFSGGCDNIFACIPSLLQAKASFVNYVMGSGMDSRPTISAATCIQSGSLINCSARASDRLITR